MWSLWTTFLSKRHSWDTEIWNSPNVSPMSRLNHSVPQGEGHMTISLICMSHLYNIPSWESTLSRGFHKLDEIGNNANIGIRGFTMWKTIQWQNVTSSGNRTGASHSLWFQVQHYPLYTNLTFACKTETLGSLYSHALLIPLKSSKSKYQVVHEQKFKDLLSSTCQVIVERIVLDWNQRLWEASNG